VPAVDPAARQAAYQKAFTTLKEGKYTEAIRDFKSFIAAYPSGEFTDNAYYWLGEANYVNRDFSAARDNFRKLTKDFPQSGKVPDAYLKLGFIEYENGQYAAAKDLLNDVIKRYPDSSAAKLAEKRLERMRQEKH
jgi:tol-pal system protein YbgF